MPFEPHLVAPDGIATPPTIDGLAPRDVVTPASAEAAAELLAEAAERGLAVAPVGGGTALTLGNPPERVDLALSTSKLGGVIDYEPTDLVLSVGAGARLGDVRAVLAEHGQELPIDPPGGDAATIGGLIATALAGPRRLGAGTLRDLLIGIAVAHPSGTVTKAGGMVVKNVTGFDLPRLYHGSLGTLGIIASANFKVLPLPRAESTVVARAASLDEALAAIAGIDTARTRPTALEAGWLGVGWLAAVRLMGRPATVSVLAAEIGAGIAGETETLDGAESAAWWRRYVEGQAVAAAENEVLIRCAVRPRATGELARNVVAAARELDIDVSYLAVSVALGSVIVRLRYPAGAGSASGLAEVQARLLAMADHVTILAAPPECKRGLDIWGAPPETLDVMRSLKEQFDPGRVLNPGRFAGHI